MFYIMLLIVCIVIGLGIAYAGKGAHSFGPGDIILFAIIAHWKIIVVILLVSALITFAW